MDSIPDRQQHVPLDGASTRHEAAGGDLHNKLRRLLEAEGCFKLRRWPVILKGGVLAVVITAGFCLLLTEPHWGTRIATLVILAVCLSQCGFLGHDAIHRTLSGRRHVDDFLGRFYVSFFSGLSYDYFFGHNHRLHHAYCGIETFDPEMQSEVIALYPDAARSKTGWHRWTSRRQAVLIWVLLTFNAFFIRHDGLRFVWRNRVRTRGDQIAIALHFLTWLIVPALTIGLPNAVINYVTITWLIGAYLTGIFPFYHVGRETYRTISDRSFLRRQVEGTRNMSASWLAEVYTGGTNNHIEHHLFPTIPTANLRRARPIVRDFCRHHGIGYHEIGYRAAFDDMVRHLTRLSQQVPEPNLLSSGQASG